MTKLDLAEKMLFMYSDHHLTCKKWIRNHKDNLDFRHDALHTMRSPFNDAVPVGHFSTRECFLANGGIVNGEVLAFWLSTAAFQFRCMPEHEHLAKLRTKDPEILMNAHLERVSEKRGHRRRFLNAYKTLMAPCRMCVLTYDMDVCKCDKHRNVVKRARTTKIKNRLVVPAKEIMCRIASFL